MLKFIVGVLCLIPFIMGIIGVIGLGLLPMPGEKLYEVEKERKNKRDKE